MNLCEKLLRIALLTSSHPAGQELSRTVYHAVESVLSPSGAIWYLGSILLVFRDDEVRERRVKVRRGSRCTCRSADRQGLQ
jgi:hypothetical protein